MRYEVTFPVPGDSRGTVVRVEAANWLAALREAVAQAGVAPMAMTHAVCEVRADGTVLAKDAQTGRKAMIRPIQGHWPVGLVAKPVKPAASVATSEGVQEAGRPATLTYMQASVEERLEMARSTEPEPPPETVRTSSHPCLILRKEDVEARLAQIRSHESARTQPKPKHPKVSLVQDSEWDALFATPTVASPSSEFKKPDTLTALKVDLDELTSRSSNNPAVLGLAPLPDGFEWLSAPLGLVLNSAHAFEDLLERTLRLLLAAVPSRLACVCMLETRQELKVDAAVGMNSRQVQGRRVRVAGTAFEMCMNGQLAMAFDSNTVPHSSAEFQRLLGSSARDALLATVTTDGEPIGVLVLMDCLGSSGFRPDDLIVCTHFAARLGDRLRNDGYGLHNILS